MHEPKIKGTAQVPTVTEVGAALFGLGIAGLAHPIISFLMTIPFAIWFSLSLVLCGAFLMLSDSLHRFFTPECFHFIAAKWMENAQATGMKMMLLGNMSSATPDELKTILAGGSSSGCSNLVSGLIDSQDAGEVMHVLFSGAREVAEYACAEFVGVSAEQTSTGKQVKKDEQTCTVPEDALTTAVAWAQRADSTLGYDEQLTAYGLAQQAVLGDCKAELVQGPVVSAKKASWENHRGVSRNDAAAQLVSRMLERDFAARKSYPHLVPVHTEHQGQSRLRLLCELIEKRLPMDLDCRVRRFKRRLQFFAVVPLLVSALAYLRHRRNRGKRPPLALLTALASVSSYLVALHQGLPAAVFDAMPRALRAMPESAADFADRNIGGAAPRLLQAAMQACMPPVSIHSRQQGKATD